MSLFQLLVVAFLVLVFMFYFRFFRTRITDKIVVLMGASSILFFVIFPDYLSDIAHLVGVGRGVDLVFYISLLLGAFVIFVMYTKILALEKSLTDVARQVALSEVQENIKHSKNQS